MPAPILFKEAKRNKQKVTLSVVYHVDIEKSVDLLFIDLCKKVIDLF